jgi:hypothetical protein
VAGDGPPANSRVSTPGATGSPTIWHPAGVERSTRSPHEEPSAVSGSHRPPALNTTRQGPSGRSGVTPGLDRCGVHRPLGSSTSPRASHHWSQSPDRPRPVWPRVPELTCHRSRLTGSSWRCQVTDGHLPSRTARCRIFSRMPATTWVARDDRLVRGSPTPIRAGPIRRGWPAGVRPTCELLLDLLAQRHHGGTGGTGDQALPHRASQHGNVLPTLGRNSPVRRPTGEPPRRGGTRRPARAAAGERVPAVCRRHLKADPLSAGRIPIMVATRGPSGAY